MTRTALTRRLLLVFLLVTPAPTFAVETHSDPHVRSTEPDLIAALAEGRRASPTLRRLVETLEASDVIVYLTFDRHPSSDLAGRISLITASPGRRYLRISIDQRLLGCQRLALLGHELHHAVEIAESKSVRDQATLTALYRRIGFSSGVRSRADCFDSAGAILAGRIVQKEVLAADNAGGSR